MSVCALRSFSATRGWGVRSGCVCAGSGFGCAPPLLAGVMGVCVFVCALRLYSTTPGWGVLFGCVCLGSGFCFDPPLLAGPLGCPCVCMRAPLAPPDLLDGCAGHVEAGREPGSVFKHFNNFRVSCSLLAMTLWTV